MPEADLPAALVPAARALFGDQLGVAEEYARLLATDGVLRGLVGPREAPRIWDRHLLNCAALAELIDLGSSIIDVGSGAGLPGVVLAIARPDLTVALVEPLARRTAFLTEVVDDLGLADRVTVLRGRAEELSVGLVGSATGPVGAPTEVGDPAAGWVGISARSLDSPAGGVGSPAGLVGPADVVTARAVAPLDRLAAWCLPLARLGGRVLALKGATAAVEVAEHRDAIARLGGGTPELRRCGVGVLDLPATVVEIVRARGVGRGTPDRSARPRSALPRSRPRRSR
jgi:16S rRNA (guanine527-N7)-methyltransferase